MTDNTPPLADLLQRQLATTPVGRDELREPQSGLSLPQRWLLRRLDGQATLADLAQQPGCPAVERLPRDAARLVGLGLAYDVGDPGPGVSMFGPTTQMGDSTLTLSLDDLAPASTGDAAEGDREGPGRRLVWPMVAMAGLAVGAGAWWMLRAPAAPSPVAAAAPAVVASSAAAAASASASAVAAAPPPAAAVEPAAPPAVPTTLVITAPEASAPARLLAATAVAPSAPTARPSTALPAAPPAPRGGAAAAVTAAPAPPAYTPAATSTSEAPALAPTASPGPVTAYPPAIPPAGPAPTPAPPPATTTVAPPAATAPSPVPPVTVTSSGPAPAVAQAPLRPTATVEPVFPREALGGGTREIVLQARLTVAPNGTVTQVTFTGSNSTQRPFERAARNALLQWRFPEGSSERSYVQSLRFREE